MNDFLKLYLPLFLFGYLVLVFVVPSIRVHRQTGINPFRFTTNHHTAHDYIGAALKVFIGLLLVGVLAYSSSPNAYRYLAPFGYLERYWIKVIGLIMGHVSLLCIMIAQYHMRWSWRIGIDYDHKTQLVTEGAFRISRNPIYLGLLFSLLGLFLVIPNALTFAVLFAAYFVLQITMRLEEDFLIKQHGEAYLNYKSKVRRLI
jgi:protein-S-isoprenylcysteine O-methyltransferase Ste14